MAGLKQLRLRVTPLHPRIPHLRGKRVQVPPGLQQRGPWCHGDPLWDRRRRARRSRYPASTKRLAKPPLRCPPGLAGTWGPCPPPGISQLLYKPGTKRYCCSLDHIFSRGSGRRAPGLTHTLFIQSFKYPIVSVFSTLIFSILMLWSPALALLGPAPAWGFFLALTSCRARGEGVSKRSHISPNPSVFPAGRGSCWGQRQTSPFGCLLAAPSAADLSAGWALLCWSLSGRCRVQAQFP